MVMVIVPSGCDEDHSRCVFRRGQVVMTLHCRDSQSLAELRVPPDRVHVCAESSSRNSGLPAVTRGRIWCSVC